MAQRRIRTWLAERIQRSPRLHACLVGIGSIMDFYPSPPPRFYRDDAAALTADMRAVGDAMRAALHRAEQEFGAPNTPRAATQRPLAAGAASNERSAELTAWRGNPAAFTTQRG